MNFTRQFRQHTSPIIIVRSCFGIVFSYYDLGVKLCNFVIIAICGRSVQMNDVYLCRVSVGLQKHYPFRDWYEICYTFCHWFAYYHSHAVLRFSILTSWVENSMFIYIRVVIARLFHLFSLFISSYFHCLYLFSDGVVDFSCLCHGSYMYYILHVHIFISLSFGTFFCVTTSFATIPREIRLGNYLLRNICYWK